MPGTQQILMPSVYVDLDDVLAETLRAFISVLRTMHGREVAFEQIKSFDLGKSFALSPKELKAFMHAAHAAEVLLDEVQPITEAFTTLRAWAAAGAHITVVTGRPISTYDATQQWLERHSAPYHILRFVRKYGKNDLEKSIRQPLPLRTLLKASFAFAVEDSPRMATFIVERLSLPVILLSKPWNAERLDVEDSPLLRRCATWAEASAYGLDLLLHTQQAGRIAA